MAQIKTVDNERMMDLYLSNIDKAIEKIDTIKGVILTFNDKVFNARVVNKLEEVINKDLPSTKHFYFKLEFNTSALKFTMRFYNYRSFAGTDYYQYLPDGMEAIDLIPYTPSRYNSYYETDGNKKYYARQEDTYFYIDGNNLRINADFICKRLDEGREVLEDKKAKLQEDRARVDEYETIKQNLIEQLKNLQCGMSWECKSVYHLKDVNTFI